LAAIESRYPLIYALCERVAARPRIAAYLRSRRRLAFNEHDLFRHYPELDAKSPRRRAPSAPAARKGKPAPSRLGALFIGWRGARL